MTDAAAAKFATWSDWFKLAKQAKRYINEGNDCFSVAVGGFTLTFDRTKKQEVKKKEES